MQKPSTKKFTNKKLTTLYGFQIGLDQSATTSGLNHEDFSKIEGNQFKGQSSVVMILMGKRFIIETNIHADNGTVARTTSTHFVHKEAQAEFNRIKKLNKLKLVDQTTKEDNEVADQAA